MRDFLVERKKLQGIGLLELLLSLTVIAILLVTATRYYGLTRDSEKVNQTVNMIVAVYSAAEGWLQSNADFTGVSVTTFINNGSLPSDFASQNVNPWGGSIVVQQNLNLGKKGLLIALSDIPLAACNNLQEIVRHRFNNFIKNRSGCQVTGSYISFDMSNS